MIKSTKTTRKRTSWMKKDDDLNHQDYDQKTIMDVFPSADNRGLFRDYNSLSAMVAVVEVKIPIIWDVI